MQNEIEIWKDIESFIGYYQISNKGRIKSVFRYVNSKNNSKRKVIDRILINHPNTNGYPSVVLSMGNITLTKTIHRLVAIAFIPNPENKPEVNHKDGDKSNCNDWNLEWSTTSENHLHAFSIGLKVGMFAEENPMSILKENEINEIRLLYTENVSQLEISKKYGVSQACISKVCLNQTWIDESFVPIKKTSSSYISGEKNVNAKLNQESIKKIVEMRNEKKYTLSKIAKIMNVSTSTIGKLLSGKTYCNE